MLGTSLIGSIAVADDALEEVTVTAQKRTERLSDVPLSITAVTGEQLANEGITSATDLERVVPGFDYQKSTYGAPVFAIRGVGVYDTFIGMSPTVTVYVDQVPLPFLAMAQAASMDLERLEVLKGPQGTLFGQNSTGGAINYIAAKPTRELQMGTDVTYGRFDEFDVNAFLSGPVTDTVQARLSVRRESRGDWQESETRPGDGLGKRDFTAARLLVDWQPNDAARFEVNLNGWWDGSDTQAAQFESYSPARSPGGYPEATIALSGLPPAPQNARIADWDADNAFKVNNRFYQASVRGDLDLTEKLTLTSISAYSHLQALERVDTDGTDFNDFTYGLAAHIDSLSQELRLAGKLGDRANYTLGGNFQHDIVDDDDIGDFNATNAGVGPDRYQNFINRADQNIITRAGFAALDFKLTDTLSAQGSARYTSQTRDFRGCLLDPGDGKLANGINFLRTLATGQSDPAAPGSCVTVDNAFNTLPIVRDSLDQSNVSWRTGLDWKPADDALLYANATKGFKAGSFTPLPAVFASQLTPVTQESVLAYELGFRLAALQRSVQLSGAAFYYDYRNKQILGYKDFAAFGSLPALQNIPKSSIRGAELQATVLPLSGLRITTGASYIDSRVDDSIIAPDPFGNSIDLKGEAFPNAPKWQFISDAEYEFAVSGGLSMFVGGDAKYRTSTNAAFGDRVETEIPAYALVDLRGGIQRKDGVWRVELWGRNVFNRYYLLNVSHVTDSVARTTGLPATYGITVFARFN
jgi:outer membrane receptor protein involved in Fe transport